MPSKKNKIKTLFPMAGNVEEFINEFDKNKFIIRIDGMPMIEKITFDYIEYIEPIYLIPENEVKARIFHQIADRNKATIVSISSITESVLHTLLFADEFRLQAPVTGTSGFTEYFAQQGPHDRQGRSLRDFDRQTRLFKYPLSYQVYSPAFDNLPSHVKRYVTERLQLILSNQDKAGDFPNLKPADRAAIREILQETKPALLKPVG